MVISLVLLPTLLPFLQELVSPVIVIGGIQADVFYAYVWGMFPEFAYCSNAAYKNILKAARTWHCMTGSAEGVPLRYLRMLWHGS